MPEGEWLEGGWEALKASRVPLDELPMTSVSPGRKGLRGSLQGSPPAWGLSTSICTMGRMAPSAPGVGDEGDTAPSLVLGTHRGRAHPGLRSCVPDHQGLPRLACLCLRSQPGPVSSTTLPQSSPGGTGCEARGPEPGACSRSLAPSLPGPVRAGGGAGRPPGKSRCPGLASPLTHTSRCAPRGTCLPES